ncbi:MAG: hypothetical protein M1409_08485 [Actinobacteria bacterium]|nr:hypothetical protein [Actinomycetota bacterium]
MKNNKKIDAVKMMRNIREELSKKYNKTPEEEQKDLVAIRKKYGLKKEVVIHF